MATTTDYINKLNTLKTNLATNLTTMGVSASSSETFNTLVPKVLQIGGFKPIYEGSLTKDILTASANKVVDQYWDALEFGRTFFSIGKLTTSSTSQNVYAIWRVIEYYTLEIKYCIVSPSVGTQIQVVSKQFSWDSEQGSFDTQLTYPVSKVYQLE